jgi:hypothetical protein
VLMDTTRGPTVTRSCSVRIHRDGEEPQKSRLLFARKLRPGRVRMLHKSTRLLAGMSMTVVLSHPPPSWAQAPGPNLVITMHHTGNFTVGVPGIYTIVVSNIGGTASTGAMDVEDPLGDLPFTFVSATGTDWSCVLQERGPPNPATLDCIRSSISPIGAGASAFPITLTVIPTVSGTWTHTAGLSNVFDVITIPTASDPTIVVAAVPTLPQWAMIALTVLLALAGVAALRRRTT